MTPFILMVCVFVFLWVGQSVLFNGIRGKAISRWNTALVAASVAVFALYSGWLGY